MDAAREAKYGRTISRKMPKILKYIYMEQFNKQMFGQDVSILRMRDMVWQM